MAQLLKKIDLSIALLVTAFCIAVGAIILHVSSLQSNLLRASAINTARSYSQTLADVRTLYTSDVVQAAHAYGMDITHDYLQRENAIPLPATFSMRLGELMTRHAGEARSQLYSAYPFPWRSAEGGLNDDFKKKAWDRLSRDQDKPYMQFLDTGQGLTLRYATADVMRPACVDCHNTHPQSPYRSWKQGDLRGVLEVSLPIEGMNQQINEEMANIRLIYSLAGLAIAAGFVVAIYRVKLVEKSLLLRSAELSVANQRLKDLSEQDPLTRIANRRCYDNRLSLEIAAAKRSGAALSLLLFDVDYFKLYNDGYGHEQGDEALKRIAAIASDCMLRETDLLARYGGEEFVAILPSTDREGAIGIAENLRARIEAAAIAHEFASEYQVVTVSIGVVTRSGPDLDAGDLFKAADTALYKAKQNGRNRCEAGNPA
jgi:diguanylate cyclase (GGDEF)-like protein